MENSNEKIMQEYTGKSTSTFFLEWLSIVGPIVGCFFFLFGEIKDQRQRTDKLYETIITMLKDKNL